MWNSTTLIPPPINSFHAKSTTIDLNAVTCILSNGMKSLNEKLFKALNTESLLLSRCVYRMKLQFRNDKGFKCMEKTNTLLKKFLQFNLISDLKSFYESVPKVYEKDLYLPTKQMLEYLLVRLQGYAQLLKRVGESAVNTAELMNNRLGLGHLWTTAAVVLALVSRVWHICKYLTKICCRMYNDLLPLRDKLELTGVKWLENEYEFPPNLIDWLDVKWLYENAEIISNFQIDLPVFNLLDESDDEDVQYCYQYKINDCIVVNDESIIEDDDVKWVATLNNNKQNNSNLDFIIDDSDASTVDLNLNNAPTDSQVDFGGNISDSSEDGVICVKSDMENTSASNANKNERKLEVIDVSSMIKDDDDIGETVSREDVEIETTIKKSKKKNKKRNRRRGRNVGTQHTENLGNAPNRKRRYFSKNKCKSEGHHLESKSIKIKNVNIKHESKAFVKNVVIKKEFKVKKEK